MQESEAPVNRRNPKKKNPRRASASGSSEDELKTKDRFHAIRTAKPAVVSPFLRNLLCFFAVVLVFCAIGRWPLSHVFDKQEFAEFHRSRFALLSRPESMFLSIFNMLLYQISSLCLGLMDFLVQAICIVTVLSPEERDKVIEAQRSIKYIIDNTKREELVVSTNPKRKQVIEHNSVINMIFGTKNFRVKIMKLEFFKECLTLNYIAIATLYFVKVILRIGDLVQQVDKLEFVLEHCLSSFLLYKNLVYLFARVWPRKELLGKLAWAILLYLAYFLPKVALLAQAIFYADDFSHSAGAVLLTALVYFCADKINAFSLINSARITLFMVLYSKK